jgi:hypothetical protein
VKKGDNNVIRSNRVVLYYRLIGVIHGVLMLFIRIYCLLFIIGKL